MKLLHTSDLHIGKKLFSRDRLEEQRAVLEEICEICDAEGVELVLIAGDVFDTYLPAAEAEELFFSFVKRLAGEKRAVVIISGNHDDAVRLCASSALSQDLGIYIVGNHALTIPCRSDRAVRPVESGEGYAVFENERGEQVYLNLLPYPNEARFKEERTDESYADKMTRWIAAGQQGNGKHLPSVFMGHIFVMGGEHSEGERSIELGGARIVSKSLLPPCDYIALGHLHKKQRLGENIYYSGSILQYSFDEANVEKCVIVFDLTKAGVTDRREIPLTRGKKLARLQADGLENAVALLKQYPNALIELTVCLNEPLTNAQTGMLKAANPNLVSLIPKLTMQTNYEFTGRKGMNNEELFLAYYREKFGGEPDRELLSLFLEISEAVQ